MLKCISLTIAIIGMLFSASALADPPPGFEYKVVEQYGRGVQLCELIWGSLLQKDNKFYLTHGPGDDANDPLRGERAGIMRFTASPGVILPNWRNMHVDDIRRELPQTFAALGRDGKFATQHYNIRRTHLDLDADNHGEDMYQIYWLRTGEFPRLFTSDGGTDLNKALAAVHANYTFAYNSVNYVMSRERGLLRIFQIASDHAKHDGAGPQLLTSKLCEYTSNVSIGGTSSTVTNTAVTGAEANYK